MTGKSTEQQTEGGQGSTRVITYGTFDLFHEGHRRLLERARKLGDYLIVAVTTESFDETRGKLNVRQSLMERIRNVQASGLADEVIIEEYEGQKVNDIQKHRIDIFVVGSDWVGKFDYLNDYCKVVYLERTRDVSSTMLRNDTAGVLRIGVVGTGRIAHRFVGESLFVSGVNVTGVYSRTASRAEDFARAHELAGSYDSYDALLEHSDAVYVATPHRLHFEQAKRALEAGRHVLCEKPMTLSGDRTAELFTLARERGLVLLEAIKTAFSPGFQRMVAVARSGSIGNVRSVDGTFTKLTSGDVRELDPAQDGGSISELASYPLLAIVKLLGQTHLDLRTVAYRPAGAGVETFARIDLRYQNAVASARTGLGVKAEGDLVIAGTSGYLYVPAPWWKTEYFEARFENPADTRRFYAKFDGDGLRYQIAEFSTMIRQRSLETFKLRPSESIWIARAIEQARASAETFG